jgi:hypothetical protein
MKKHAKWIVAIIAFVMIAQTSFSQTKEKIEKANAKGNAVFLAVTDGNIMLNEAKGMAIKAQKKYPKSEVIVLDRADKTNSALVTKYGLSGAPLPLILVMASNGVIGGGLTLKDATPEELVGLVPSKKQAQALLAFSEGKTAYIVLYRKSMKDKTNAVSECNKAAAALSGKAVVVDVDLDDKSEAGFLNLLKPEMTATNTHVLVFNGKGQFTGEFTAPVQSPALIASAKKIVKSGCAPGACGSGTSGCGTK